MADERNQDQSQGASEDFIVKGKRGGRGQSTIPTEQSEKDPFLSQPLIGSSH